jgi:site-specific DNA-methyltransferase (adenine-specific)
VTPYYDEDGITIYHGDSLEVMPQLDVQAALVATDPPYFRVVDEEWDNQWGPSEAAFLEWLGKVIDTIDPLLMDRGTLACFASPDLSAGVEIEVRRRMAVLNHIVWRKPGPGRLGQMDKSTMRRFFPTSERLILAEKVRNPDGDLFRFRDHVNHTVARDVSADVREELCKWRDAAGLTNRDIDRILGTNGMAGHYFGASQWTLPTESAWAAIRGAMKDRGVEAPPYEYFRQEFDARRREFDARRREFDARRREFDARRREFDARRQEFDARHIESLSDVWTFAPPAGRHRHDHPTQKPIALMIHILSTMSRPADLVLDPFMGSGSSLVAAQLLGRKAIGIEIEERYCEIAARRLSQGVLPLE